MYFYLKCEYISTKKQERYFYQKRGKIWPVLMAGLSTLSKVFMYFYLKCEHISMKTGKIFLSRKKKYLASFDARPLNSWKSVAKLAAAPLLPSLSSNPSSCLIHFNYCKCYFINVYHQPLMDCPLSNFYQIFSLYHRAGVPYFSYYRL